MAHAVTLDLVQRGKHWVNRVVSVLDSHIAFIEQTDPSSLTLKELRGIGAGT